MPLLPNKEITKEMNQKILFSNVYYHASIYIEHYILERKTSSFTIIRQQIRLAYSDPLHNYWLFFFTENNNLRGC